MDLRLRGSAGLMLGLFCAIAPAIAGLPPSVEIANDAKSVLSHSDARRDGILSVYDNNLFVQCVSSHFVGGIRCESAGLEGQPWLRHVLTAERQQKLISLGFSPDTHFGNFIANLPATTPAEALASLLMQVLDVYGVAPEDIEIKAEWLKSARCHHRIKAGHDRGGAILTPTIGFPQDAEKGCGMASATEAMNYDDPASVVPAGPGGDLAALYVPAMAKELHRLEEAKPPQHPYAIFIAGPAYVQCMHDDEGKQMYCEAVSEDAVGKPIERILTPERKAKLIAAGFEPPGKVMNYRRFYPRDRYDLDAVAKALLSVLQEVYGYQGNPHLTVKTETDVERPLTP